MLNNLLYLGLGVSTGGATGIFAFLTNISDATIIFSFLRDAILFALFSIATLKANICFSERGFFLVSGSFIDMLASFALKIRRNGHQYVSTSKIDE
jgi:hypothetical protein